MTRISFHADLYFLTHTDLTNRTDACSRWDAHMEFIERERHE